MTDWYASLAKIKCEVPDDVLVLPSHNECFSGLHARIDTLEKEQDRAFERLRLALIEPKRAVDVFDALFSRDISHSDTNLLSMATGESVALLIL